MIILLGIYISISLSIYLSYSTFPSISLISFPSTRLELTCPFSALSAIPPSSYSLFFSSENAGRVLFYLSAIQSDLCFFKIVTVIQVTSPPHLSPSIFLPSYPYPYYGNNLYLLLSFSLLLSSPLLSKTF